MNCSANCQWLDDLNVEKYREVAVPGIIKLRNDLVELLTESSLLNGLPAMEEEFPSIWNLIDRDQLTPLHSRLDSRILMQMITHRNGLGIREDDRLHSEPGIGVPDLRCLGSGLTVREVDPIIMLA